MPHLFQASRTYLGAVSKVSGAVLIIFGVLLYDNSLAVITASFERHDIGVYLDVERG